MKAKVAGNVVLVMHVMVLAGFSLMQGCKTAKAMPQDQPPVMPAGDDSSVGTVPPGINTPAVPAVSTSAPSKVYTVKKGDTLSAIASAHGTSWKKLADQNNLSNPNELKVGQELHISDSVIATSSSAPVKRSGKPVSSRPIAGPIKQGGTYVVQKGDMLSSIAKRCGLTAAEIKTANSMTNDSITVGKKLTIPKKGEAKAAAATKPAVAKSAASKPAAPVKPAAPIPAPAPIADGAQSSAATVSAAPVAAQPTPAVPEAAPVARSSNAPVYEHVLYPGETLDDVARQYGSSQQEIMKLNNITDAAAIKPGTKLLVPIPE